VFFVFLDAFGPEREVTSIQENLKPLEIGFLKRTQIFIRRTLDWISVFIDSGKKRLHCRDDAVDVVPLVRDVLRPAQKNPGRIASPLPRAIEVAEDFPLFVGVHEDRIFLSLGLASMGKMTAGQGWCNREFQHLSQRQRLELPELSGWSECVW
jgi:hypothetical protein